MDKIFEEDDKSYKKESELFEKHVGRKMDKMAASL